MMMSAFPSARRLALATLLLSGTALPVLAQSADPATADGAYAPEIVVTASSIKQTLITAPASISVVNEEQLHERPARDLTEVLDRVEGVTINRSGNQRTIQMRGLNSAYTLFMIDGKRVNSTNAMFRGNDFDAGWVPIEAIQRVEVVRGPMSSLYGSDAIGGVVNIITKPVGESWSGTVSADYILQEDGDAGDAYKTGFFAAGPLMGDKLGLKLYGGYNRRLKDGDINNSPTLTGFRDKHEEYLDGTLVWNPAEGHEVTGNYGYNRLTHDNFPMERQSYALTHKGEYGFGNSQLRYSGDRIENEVGNVTGQTNPNKAENDQIDGRFTLPLDNWFQTATVGAEWRRQSLKDPANLRGLPGTAGYNQDPTTQVDQHAFFIEDEIRFTEDLRLTIGDRYDDHENFGGHHSPRGYVVWQVADGFTVKSGISKAFRAPTLLQNSPKWGSVSCGSATVGCYIIGSDELKPETATSKEAGLRYDSADLSAGVTLFETDLKNMIDITSRTANRTQAPSYSNFVGFLPDGRPIFRYQNISKVHTRGVESNVGYRFDPAWDVAVNYTWLESRNRSNPVEIPMIYQPKHSWNATVNWQPTDALKFYVSGNYVGRQYLQVSTNSAYNITQKGYANFDLGGSYSLNDTLTVRAGVLNIADKQLIRETSTEYNEDGRRFFFAVTQKF